MPDDVEAWLDQLNPDDPRVRVRDGVHLRRVAAAADAVCAAEEELNDAVDAAQEAGDPPGLIRMALRAGGLPQLRPDLIPPAVGPMRRRAR